MSKFFFEWNQKIADLEAENKELRATIMKIHEEYRQDVLDAERYRWLRDGCRKSAPHGDAKQIVEFGGEDWDAAIDAAKDAEQCAPSS